MHVHDYSISGGLARVQVGRFLATASALISAILVFILLWAVDLAARFGWPVNVPPAILSLVGAGVVFLGLYTLLNKLVWRWPLAAKLLKVPDISGEWRCTARSINPSGGEEYNWGATVLVTQTWEKIRVRLTTETSISDSDSAALIFDEEQFRLFYSYTNRPRMAAMHLTGHRGFAELMFSSDLTSAEGEYFNGNGRFTFGEMKLERA